MSITPRSHFYSIVIAIHPSEESTEPHTELQGEDWRLGEINVDWVDFTREKSVDQDNDMPLDNPPQSTRQSPSGPSRRKGASQSQNQGASVPGSGSGLASSSSPSSTPTGPERERKKRPTTDPDSLSLQPLLAHFPGPNPLDSSVAQGVSEVGRGVVHLFRHAPPAHLIASLESHPVGEGSGRSQAGIECGNRVTTKDDWGGDRAEGEDGSLIAILAVPAWMRPADFLEFIGGWGTCLEGVRMIREATTPNRSIVLLKFRDPLQASDFLVIFSGRPFSTLDARETCHPIRIHHLVLHKLDTAATATATTTTTKGNSSIAVPAFPPSVYASRVKALPDLVAGVPSSSKFELPSCPVCLERLDSTVTGLVTLPCAHTFDCDCLKKWGDSRCPVCRVSHLLLSSAQNQSAGRHRGEHITRATRCATCDSTENNWICVVCGVVGCGRYDPGKGHARRHWEESGHVLAMELETQRVWDYKGDNYVHRLIQTRNDGKLVELPSASSLVTSFARPLPFNDQPRTPRHRLASTESALSQSQTTPPNGTPNGSSSEAGPSSNDIDKMSTIEAITLEYSYLLSSQLEAMRQHYETQQSDLQTRLSSLESQMTDVHRLSSSLESAQKEKEKAEKKAKQATELSRSLQTSLAAERAMTQGLSERVKMLENVRERTDREKRELEDEKMGLEETVKDLMFSLEAGIKIQQLGGEGGEGGDLVVRANEKPTKGKKGKK